MIRNNELTLAQMRDKMAASARVIEDELNDLSVELGAKLEVDIRIYENNDGPFYVVYIETKFEARSTVGE